MIELPSGVWISPAHVVSCGIGWYAGGELYVFVTMVHGVTIIAETYDTAQKADEGLMEIVQLIEGRFGGNGSNGP